MNMKNTRSATLFVGLGLFFCWRAEAESRVVRDQFTDFDQSQVVAALKSAMAKEGCNIGAEKTYKGSGIQEVKCNIGEEKVTAQVSRMHFSGTSLRGQSLDTDFTSLWLKTSGGKANWSKVLDKDINDILHSGSKSN